MLLALCLSSTLSRAEDVYPISKGEASPIDGVVFSLPKAKEIKNELLDKDTLAKQAELYKANEELLNNQVKLWRDQSNNLSKQLVDEQHSFWGKAGFFLLGSALTVGTAWALRGSLK